ncbi:MAG: hypothetical protein KGZ25_08620 [Planctomycetes bacterium]|nr:hypothetical protein [Planctomycetota bacterium]
MGRHQFMFIMYPGQQGFVGKKMGLDLFVEGREEFRQFVRSLAYEGDAKFQPLAPGFAFEAHTQTRLSTTDEINKGAEKESECEDLDPTKTTDAWDDLA